MIPGLLIMSSARVEYHMFKNLSSSANIEVEFQKLPITLKLDENKLLDQKEYPLTVTVTTSADKVSRNGARQMRHACIYNLAFLTVSGRKWTHSC